MDPSVTEMRNVDSRLVWEACKANDRSLLRSLLANGGQPDWYPEEDPSAKSCLYMAALRGDLAMTKDLIKHGADVNKVGGPDEGTPFHVAAATNNMKLAELLIEFGADVNKAGGPNDMTPLHVAAATGNMKLARLLIELGADVNKSDYYGKTALYTASYRNSMLMVELLIKSGADTDLPDACLTRGWTPMHIAALGNFLEIVRLLIKSGARKDMPDVFGCTPLHVAVVQENGEVAAELLKAGVDMNTRNRGGETPLATAVRLGHSRMVLLLANEADTNWHSNVSVEDFRQILDIRSANKTAEMSAAISKGLVLVLLGACTTFILTGGPKRLGNALRFLQRSRSK